MKPPTAHGKPPTTSGTARTERSMSSAKGPEPAGEGGMPPDPAEFLRDMADAGLGYARAERDRVKILVGERGGRIAGGAVLVLVVILLLAGLVLMVSVAWGLWLGQRLQDPVVGFLLAGATYLALVGFFYLFWRTVLRDRITLFLLNAIHGEE